MSLWEKMCLYLEAFGENQCVLRDTDLVEGYTVDAFIVQGFELAMRFLENWLHGKS